MFAQLFQAIANTVVGQLNLQGGNGHPRIVREVASGSMQFQSTTVSVFFFPFCDFGPIWGGTNPSGLSSVSHALNSLCFEPSKDSRGAKGSSVSWVAKLKGDTNSEYKL